MDIGLQADSPSVNRAVEILSAIYAGHAAAGKVLKMFYLDLFRELQKHEVQYIVVGGLAVVLHGYARATADVDLVLALDETNLSRFLKTAQTLQLKPSLPVTIEALCDAAQLDAWVRERHMIAFALRSPSPTAPTIDIIVRPKVLFADMYANRVEKALEDVTVPLASIDDLIAPRARTWQLEDEYDVRILTQLREPPENMNADPDQADIQRIREEIRASRRMTGLERLQWLEEICVFTNMFRQAPEVVRADSAR